MDEITTSGPTVIYRLKEGEITHAEFTPADFGIERSALSEIQGGSVADNVAILRRVLEAEAGPYRDAAVINAAPALVVSGLASGFVEAVELAGRTIDSGAAAALLDRVVARSRDLSAPEPR